MGATDQRNPIPIDNPINSIQEDRLGRGDTVKSFVDQILELDASQGLSVGVFGPWGSGKTSFIRLAKEQFRNRDVTVVDFNPWMFSGSEQLVTRFFTELSGELVAESGLDKVGKALAAYGGTLVGAVNLVSATFAGFPALAELLTPFLRQLESSSGKKGLNERRDEVERALSARDEPLVVILDDVDRLSFAEIRDVFKLVRLTASFPNLVYLVACDRHRVGQALAGDGGDAAYGHQYLEKIIQFPFDLPEVPRHLLEGQIEEALTRAVPDADALLADEDWPDIYDAVVEPLIANMREVRRYAAVVRAAARDLSEKVSIGDVLALEAVRLFLPGVFKLLHGAVDALTYPAESRTSKRELARFRRGGIGPDQRSKELIQSILNAAEDRKPVVEAMIKYLFPYGERVAHADDQELWEEHPDQKASGHRRVADEAVLRLYLERVVGYDLLVLADAERALLHMADGREELEAFLRSLDAIRQVDVIRAIGQLSDSFQPEHAKAGVPVLLNLLPGLPNEPLLIDRRSGEIALAVVYRLLRVIGNPAQVQALAESILPAIETLSSKVELSALIGRSVHESDGLVSREAITDFDGALAEEIRTAFSNDEIDEPERFAWVVSFPARVNLAPIALPDSAEMDFRLAHSAQGTSISSENGASRYLDWNLLGTLYGSDGLARSRVERLCSAFDEREWDERLDGWGVTVDAARETIRTARSSLQGDD